MLCFLAMNGHARGKDSVMEARVRQVLQLRTESAAMFEALEAINDFYGQAYSVKIMMITITSE